MSRVTKGAGVSLVGPQGAQGIQGVKGDPGSGFNSGVLASIPSAAALKGTMYTATDAGLTRDQQLWTSDGTYRHAVPLEFNVLSFGADPTGVAASDTAFANAIAAAATDATAQAAGRMGVAVYVPPGTYKLNTPLEIYGSVTVYAKGPGPGAGAGPVRLNLGPSSCVILHSISSGPLYAPSAGAFRGFDVYATRPTFLSAGWQASTAYTQGQNIRVRGDFRAYWKCLVAGTSGTTPPAAPSITDLSRPWQANEHVGYRTARRATGRYDVIFTNSGAGTTGGTEPAWNFTLGATTVDGGVTWTAVAPVGLWVDGSCVWQAQAQSVNVFGGSVSDLYVIGMANYAVTLWGDIGYVPYCNVNGVRCSNIYAVACAGGVTCHGGDSSAGLFDRVFCFTLGYEDNQTTPIPYDGDAGTIYTRTRANSPAHGVWDDSFFGNTWVNVLIETVEGSGIYDVQANGGSNIVGAYAENCAPCKHPRSVGSYVINTAGFTVGGQGGTANPISGAQYDSLLFRPSGFVWSQSLAARSNYRDLPGFFTLHANHPLGEYLGWHRGYLNIDPYVWALQSFPYGLQRIVGAQLGEAPEGAGWRNYGITFHGTSGSDYFICTLSSSVMSTTPWLVRRGQRKQGDRHEPKGGIASGGVTYVGRWIRDVADEGWDGAAYNAAGSYLAATSLQPAHVVTPGNGYAYQCTTSGTAAGALLAAPSTTPGATVTDGTCVWTVKSTVAVWRYYGASL